MALPVNGSTHLIPAYYSFYRPRKDESGHPLAAGRAQDRESSPARDRRSTTEPRHQLSASIFPEIQYTSDLRQTAVDRSFSGSVAIRYVLPDLWMTSHFLVMGHNCQVSVAEQSLHMSDCVLRAFQQPRCSAKIIVKNLTL